MSSDPHRRMPDGMTSGLVDLLRRNIEIGSLLLLCLIVAAIWGLAELTDEVVEGATRALDTDILLALRTSGDLSDPIGPPYLEEMARDLTALGGTVVITGATLFAAGFFLMRGSLGSMVYLLVAAGGGIILSSIGKEVFDRPRPDLVPHGSLVYTASFPSGHSMMAAVAYLTLGVLIARVLPGWPQKVYVMSIAVILTVLVGISRVYLGVHWPTDVAAGWLAGAAWAVACVLFARLLSRRGHVEPEMCEEG
jgi:undecaprenyl-diphosphatase